MNKFLTFDENLEIGRLPLSYSLGDLDRIRRLFGGRSVDTSIALPQLPPQRDVIDDVGTLGYLVYPPFELKSRITEFLEKTITHVRELKGKGYDFKHPQFKAYLTIRDNCVNYLADKLEMLVAQERRLGVFNIFWLAVTKQVCISLEEVLVEVAGSQKLRYLIHPHLKSMLNQVLKQVYDKLAYQDEITRQNIPFYRGTLKSKLGANFNFHFVDDILNVQLSLLEPSISPLDPLFQIRKILVDENSEYYITYKNFLTLFQSIRKWLRGILEKKDEWVTSILSQIFGLPQDKIVQLNVFTIMFEPEVIFKLQESLRHIPLRKSGKSLSIRKKTLIDEIGEKVWYQVFLDYIKLSSELQKAELISFFRDRVLLLGSEYWRADADSGEIRALKDKVTYNFNSGKLINDQRKVTLLFVDLRGFTETASDLISVHQLKDALYNFFDPTLDVIDHFKGQIRFFAGDAVLATFGAETDEKERSLNAVRVGIHIQRMLQHLVNNQKLPFEGVGIGIHVGQVENAYIFKNAQQKIDTVIGLAANITSRLSSGKSVTSERRGDPTLIRELQDTFQDVLEEVKGKVSPNLKAQIVRIFEKRLAKYSGDQSSVYLNLPEMKVQPGTFRVSVVGGVLNNNGIVLSDETFSEIRQFSQLRTRPHGDNIEFVLKDEILGEDIVFWQAGDAVLKGIEGVMPVWGVAPADQLKR